MRRTKQYFKIIILIQLSNITKQYAVIFYTIPVNNQILNNGNILCNNIILHVVDLKTCSLVGVI